METASTASDDEYSRLLYALNIESHINENIHYLTSVSNLLKVSMASVSDCIRRGRVVTPPVLAAAIDVGINPAYIKKGLQPVFLDGYALADQVAHIPKRLYS